MKKQFLFLLIALPALPFLLIGCEKETLLTVDQTSINIPDTGGSQTVTLTANKPWSVSSNQSWCKVSPSAGEEATSSRITISCDPNTTYDARNATVTFTCVEMTKTVTVSQATNYGLLVSQTEYNISNEKQQLNIEVRANVRFSVEVDDGCKDWVKYNSTKALNISTVVLDIAENKSYDGREGKVIIKQDGGNLSATVTIKQSQLEGLFVTTSEYNLSYERQTLTVEVKSNIEFEVKPEVEWIKYVQTKGLQTNQIVLDVAENETYESREGKVSVKQNNGELSGFITIKQTGRIPVKSITLNKTSLEMVKGSVETLIATIKPNDAFEQSASWASSDSTVVSVYAGELKALKGGHATITASAGSKSAKCDITVIVLVESVSIDKSSLTLEEGEIMKLTAIITPSDATDKKIVWTSSSPDIAGVDSTGIVTAKKRGSATITATAGGKKGECRITINPKGTYIGDVLLSTDEEVKEFGEKRYRYITGSLTIGGVTSLQWLNNTIEDIEGSLIIDRTMYNYDGLYGLKRIGGSMTIRILDKTNGGSMEGLNNIEQIGGDLAVSYYPHGATFDGMNSLKEIGGNFLFVVEGRASITGLQSLMSVGGDFSLVSESLYHYDQPFYISGFNCLQRVSGTVKVCGFCIQSDCVFPSLTHVGSISIEKMICNGPLFNVLKYVDKDFLYSDYEKKPSDALSGLNNLSSVGGDFILNQVGTIDNFKSLETIGGSFTFNARSDCSECAFEKLKTIGGSYRYVDRSSTSNLSTMYYPLLQHIGGDFFVAREYEFGENDYINNKQPIRLYFPKLERVPGSITIRIRSSANEDSSFMSLSSAGSLWVKGDRVINKILYPRSKKFTLIDGGDVYIGGGTTNTDIIPFEDMRSSLKDVTFNSCQITDFTPLIPIVSRMTGTWSVNNCLYNPTKYQMLNGEAKKPE